jgi:hypothetical protein
MALNVQHEFRALKVALQRNTRSRPYPDGTSFARHTSNTPGDI